MLRRTIGASGREWVTEHLDIERSIDQYANLYRELVDRA